MYIIITFKEFQEEFTGKMYCSIVSTEEGSVGMRYEVREDIIIDERVKEKKIRLFLRMIVVILFATVTCSSLRE